jgi:P-type Cu+ transporter
MKVCPSCAKDVDPLRAGHVAIFDDEFYYFCDRSCRERLAPLVATSAQIESAARRAIVTLDPAESTVAGSFPVERRTTSNGHARHATPSSAQPSPEVEVSPSSSSAPPSLGTLVREAKKAAGPREGGTALAWASVASGVLAISLVLAGPTPWAMALRVALASLGWICIVIRAVRVPRDPTDVHPALLLAPGFAACAVAAATWLLHDPATDEAATFAGVVVTAAALSLQLVERARQSIMFERIRIAEALASATRRSKPADSSPPEVSSLANPSVTLKPGEETSVEAGDLLPVDGTIVAGEAVVLPWLGARESVKRRDGDALLSGARIISGKLRVRASYTGLDRAWTRLTLDPRRRADVHARVARVARALAGRGGLLGMILGALAGIANGESAAGVALTAIAAWASITTAAVGTLAAVHVGRGILEGLRRGIAYRCPADWDKAGEVSIAAFCARGTLLLGEPELADLEVVGKASEEQVLGLAAGAESLSIHPVAMAIQRAAIARRIRPDAVRSPSVQPGLGVLSVASTGEALAVGTRALMLKEKISIAVAEQKTAEIEAHGREVLLVALGGKLVGVLGLQDGLRPGARAAVQHLLDAQVEPVLISGDSRETCEAIGRALDIDHIRPEIPLAERAVEIERLGQGGLTVAVLGHPRTDEAALSAAQVAVAMPAQGGASGEWGIMLASDDVRDGALAISLARRTKNDARIGLTMAVAPGILLALAVAFRLLPPAYAPLAALFGAAASALHARATDLTRTATTRAAKSGDFFRPADASLPDKVH